MTITQEFKRPIRDTCSIGGTFTEISGDAEFIGQLGDRRQGIVLAPVRTADDKEGPEAFAAAISVGGRGKLKLAGQKRLDRSGLDPPDPSLTPIEEESLRRIR